MARALGFEQAKAQFVHRYTCEHVPAWATKINPGNGRYYAPQYATDREWYENTQFHGESDLASRRYCHSENQSWPYGQWLDSPFHK